MNDETPNSENSPPKPGRALAAWQDFEAELRQREQSIAGLLPQHVSKTRFINSAIAAVKQTPALLTSTPRSLFAAIAKSAQDGLLPDGREGVITVYREKQKDNSYVNVAQWNPMIYGLRKRARELDSILINAQVVHENDHFVREEGDNPHIEHRPAQLGEARGAMIGAYAIFRNDSGILHREVMDADQIEAVRAQSKAPDSLMWKKFTQEAWRKTVVRRGIKSVPCSEPLETIVRRDDDLFNFEAEPGNGKSKRPAAIVVQPPADGERKPLPPIVGQDESPKESAGKRKRAAKSNGTSGASTEDGGAFVASEADVEALVAEIAELDSMHACFEWMRSHQLERLASQQQLAVTTAFLKRQDELSRETV